MSYPKIKKSLFSFKTFRSPNRRILTDNKYYIYHPDFSKSRFYNCKDKIKQLDISKSNNEQIVEFIETLEPINNYKLIKEQYPILFEFYTELERSSISTISTREVPDIEKPSERELILIWDELFTQLITEKSDFVRQILIQLIKVIYLLENRDLIKDFSKLIVVIPLEFVECLKEWRQSKCNGELFGVYNLGIEDYRRVEQTLCCYVPGEVSQIENIMAKEYKEKKTRSFVRTETGSETEFSSEMENLNDTTTTDRNELAIEIARQQQENQGFNINGSVSVSGKYGVAKITANTSTGYSNNNSSSLSNTEARNYSKEVTERALEKIIQKVNERRTFKMIKEFEENYKHGYDNRKGEQHITGVYRWVDKVYDNQLINYGKRLLFEIDLPEPALLYKKAMDWEKKKDEEETLKPPKRLEDFGINSERDINNDNIKEVASYYGIEIDKYEAKNKKIVNDFSRIGLKNSNKSSDIYPSPSDIQIQEDFVVNKIEGIVSFYAEPGITSSHTLIHIDSVGDFQEFKSGSKGSVNFSFTTNVNNLSGPIVYRISYRKTTSVDVKLTLFCVSAPELYDKWQKDSYKSLMDAYNLRLEEYKRKLEEEKANKEAERLTKEEESRNTNPEINRLTEQRELKRLSIEMLAHPYCYDFGKSFYNCKEYKCKSNCSENQAVIPQIIQTKELEDFAKFSQFFETVFDWDILSYTLYPYYYNEKCNWLELLQTKNPDPIFQAFLQSGMAKVIVPVRPQYERAVMWYIETGEINMDNELIPDTLDEKYQTTLEDLENRDKEVPVGKPWKTRIPSTLTIIQAQSTYFKDKEGLPCCDEESKSFGLEDRHMEGNDNQTE